MTNKPLIEKVRDLLQEKTLLPPQSRVLVALSGGADSVALLQVLLLLQEELAIEKVAAVHIHHGLRGEEADSDEAFVRALCTSRKVPLFVQHEDVASYAKAAHLGLEEAGRAVRYAVFEELRDQEGFTHIATAHTQSDNTETVLLHLARGTGMAGLQGIPVCRGQIIRPLLTCAREDVEEFCDKHSLTFVTDSTNADVAFSRNRVRNCIVPELYAINPRLHEAVARLSTMACEDEVYWEAVTSEHEQTARLQSDVYDAAVLASMPLAVQRRVVQRILASRCGNDYEEQHIRRIMSLLTEGGAVTVTAELTVSVKQGYLMLNSASAVQEDKLQPGQVYQFGDRYYRAEVWDYQKFEKDRKIYKILLQSTCDYDKIIGVAYVRNRREGDACTPYRRGGRRTLKKWFNAEKIPATQRDRVPVVADEKGVVLVVGLGCDDRVAIDDTTQRILLFLETNEER